MASIVKANSSLTAGGLAVIKRSFSTQKEGKLNYSVTYVCLSQFQHQNASRFQTGSNPPTPFLSALGALKIKDTPTLYDLQTEVSNGLCYFTASYVSVGDSESSFSVTETSDQRSFQASETKTVTTGTPGFLTENEATDTISFDYISLSATVSSNNRDLPNVGSSGVGAIFNIRKARTFSGGGTFQGAGSVSYEKTTILSTSSTRNSDGTYTYSRTSSGVVVAD
jgi:hypothetical protein